MKSFWNSRLREDIVEDAVEEKEPDEEGDQENTENGSKGIKNTSLAAPGALAHRLQRRTACNAAPPAGGPQNGRRGLERCLPLGFWAF